MLNIYWLIAITLLFACFTYIILLQIIISKQKLNYNKINTELLDTKLKIEFLVKDLLIANKEIELYKQQKQVLLDNKQYLSMEFTNLANQIFDEKTANLTKQNQSNLSNLLQPFKEQIKYFEQKVEHAYITEGKERACLKEQITTLVNLNWQINDQAKNLASALKGNNKIQGSWGEMILETILEKAGLVKDREYSSQMAIVSADGKMLRPDIIINLPQNKALIIDAKVSLKAYESYYLTNDKESKQAVIKEHITSIKRHIKNLSVKNYQNLYKLDSLDFILLFIPIESAFSLAIQNDSNIFDEAINNNIVIVCPTILLATMKTIANIWKRETISKDAKEIANLGRELFNKFSLLNQELEQLDKLLIKSQDKVINIKKYFTKGQSISKLADKLKQLQPDSI